MSSPSYEDIYEDGVLIKQIGDEWVAAVGTAKRGYIVRENSEPAFWAALSAWADQEGYWPGIYEVNDHGNITQYDYQGNAVGSWV